MIVTYLTLTYPDKETALGVARALSGNPEVTEFPACGWLGGVYYDIVDLQNVGAAPAEPGYHLLGAWRGPMESVPAPVRNAHVERPDSWPRMSID